MFIAHDLFWETWAPLGAKCAAPYGARSKEGAATINIASLRDSDRSVRKVGSSSPHNPFSGWPAVNSTRCPSGSRTIVK